MSLTKLCRELRVYITKLNRGKKKENDRYSQMVQKEAQKLQLNQEIDKIRQTWPQPIPDTLKKKIVKLFNEKTSSECLASFTCASNSTKIYQT